MNLSLKSLFTLDLRALALMRIAIGITIITDLIIRCMDLEAHYTNDGVLPLDVLHKFLWNPLYFSIHTAATSFQWQLIFFIINFIAGFCLIFGYRTRLFTFICWLFVLSLHNRNPLVQQAGDDFLRLILFWAFFLPWGYYYSIDSLKLRGTVRAITYDSIAGFGFVCQVAFLYFFSALLKNSPEWNQDFTALYYALSLDQILTPVGKFVYSLRDLHVPLTASVYYAELLLPLILFIPFKNARFRLIFVIAILLLQIGINLCLNVGLFSLICVVSLIGLIPSFAIEKLRTRALVKRVKGVFSKWFSNISSNVPQVFLPKENNATKIFLSIILLYMVAWNLQTTGKKVLPEKSHAIAHLLRVDQFWGMFAPRVFKDDGWFILMAKTGDGKTIDLFRNGAMVDYTKPEYIADLMKNDRWRKYYENILLRVRSHFRPYFCSYLLRQWNTDNPTKEIKQLDIIYMKEYTLPDYRTEDIQKEILCTCSI